jgi:hypothetical protein
LLFDTGSLVAELLELPAFLLSLLVAARNIGLLLRAEEMLLEELRDVPMPQFTLALFLVLMLLPGAELPALALGLIRTEAFAVDKFDMLDTAVVESLLLRILRDCAGMLVCAGFTVPTTRVVDTLLRGDITVTLLLDRLDLVDILALLRLRALALVIDLAALLTEGLGLDIALLLTDL